MLITCCLLAADGVLQISGKRKLTSGKMEDKENGKTPAQLKDELSGLKMRALQQKAEEVGVDQDLIDTADDSKGAPTHFTIHAFFQQADWAPGQTTQPTVHSLPFT